MDKKIVGLVGAITALVALDGAQAATPPVTSSVLSAQSYADLLQPIPNAVALLAAGDAALANGPATRGVQVADDYHHHHHHHHHHHYRRHHHHHHYHSDDRG